MKKTIILCLLVFVVVFSIAGCEKNELKPKDKEEEKFTDLVNLRSKPFLVDGKKYIPAHNRMPEGKKPLTVYFPDSNYMFLVPVTRFVDGDSDLFNSCIRELQNGAGKSSGLSPYSPIGKINNVYYESKNRQVTVDLSSEDPKYAMGSTGSMVYLGSLLRSYAEIPDVDQIQFLLDGKKVESIFHGSTDDDKPYKLRKNPEAYVILETESRLYLLPAPNYEPFKTEVSQIEDLAKELFSVLKAGKKFGDFQLKPTVHKDVKLNKVKRNGNVLELDFDEAIKDDLFLKDKPNFVLLDSLVYTFTSIPGIDEIKISIEGKPLNTLNDVKFPESFKRFSVINDLTTE